LKPIHFLCPVNHNLKESVAELIFVTMNEVKMLKFSKIEILHFAAPICRQAGSIQNDILATCNTDLKVVVTQFIRTWRIMNCHEIYLVGLLMN